MPTEFNPPFPSELPEIDAEQPTLPLLSDAYNLNGNTQFVSAPFRPGFLRGGRFFRQGGLGGCGSGGCFLPNHGAYRMMDHMRQQPQQQLWGQIQQMLGPLFRELRTFIQNLSRHLGHAPDAAQRQVRAFPPQDIGEGRTLQNYSNGDFVITNNTTHRALRARIDGATYVAAPGHEAFTRTIPGSPPRTETVHGTITFGPNGVRFTPRNTAPPLPLDIV